MRLWETAIRAPGPASPRDLIRAMILTVVVPLSLGALLLWLLPSGCDLRGEASTYLWTCLFPGLLMTVSIVLAVLLPVAVVLNRRLARPLPDGWLVVIPTVGVLTQFFLYGGYLLTLDAAYRELFLAELLAIPQPFVVGAIAGAIFWVSLHWNTTHR